MVSRSFSSTFQHARWGDPGSYHEMEMMVAKLILKWTEEVRSLGLAQTQQPHSTTPLLQIAPCHAQRTVSRSMQRDTWAALSSTSFDGHATTR